MFGLLKTAFAGLLILCTLCNQSKLTVSKNPEVPSPTPVLLERGMCRNGAELVKRLRRAERDWLGYLFLRRQPARAVAELESDHKFGAYTMAVPHGSGAAHLVFVRLETDHR